MEQWKTLSRELFHHHFIPNIDICNIFVSNNSSAQFQNEEKITNTIVKRSSSFSRGKRCETREGGIWKKGRAQRIMKETQTQLSGTFPPFIIVNWKFISTSVRKSFDGCFKRCPSLFRNDESELRGIISWWMPVNRGYWGIRSGSCSSSIVSIFPLVLMLDGL